MRASILSLIVAAAISGVAIAEDQQAPMEVVIVTAPMPAELARPVIDSTDYAPLAIEVASRAIEPPTLSYEATRIVPASEQLAATDGVPTKT